LGIRKERGPLEVGITGYLYTHNDIKMEARTFLPISRNAKFPDILSPGASDRLETSAVVVCFPLVLTKLFRLNPG
jgi:hypothetical protein